MQIKTRLTICFAIVLALAVGTTIPVLLRGLSDTILKAEDRELAGYLEAVRASAIQRTDAALALAELVAASPEAAKALEAGDRGALIAMFSGPYLRLRRDEGVEQFQFHLPPARSFLRLHQPELFGDDLESLRPMVVESSAASKSVKGLETGVAGLGARAVAPITDGARLIGTVEFGMNFGQKFVEEFKSRFGADLAIHLPDMDGFRTVAATSDRTLADDDALRTALNHATVIKRDHEGGHPTASILAAFDDFSGKPAAVVEIAMDAGEYSAQYRNAKWKAWGLGGFVLLAGLALSVLIARTISRPLTAMTEAMDRLAAGDPDVGVPPSGRNDEIGKMSRAMVVFKQNRAEVERQKNERDQMSRLSILGEMASSIAHEINQPLASISNYGRGMARMLDEPELDRDKLKTGAQGIAEQAERAAAIIQRIRGFVRRRDKARQAFDIEELVAESRLMFDYVAQLKGITFFEDADADLPPAQADRVEIQQVLLNLYQNAIDALPEGGTVVTRLSMDHGLLHVEVADNGPGLDEATRDRLFEPFFTTKPNGLGLGLSICRTILESHGGALWAAPNPDGGAAMHFTMPCQR